MNKKILLPSSRTLIAAEPCTQGEEAIFLYTSLTVHIWQCRCVTLTQHSPSVGQDLGICCRDVPPSSTAARGCGRHYPALLFSCWKGSLRDWPTALGALAQVLRQNLGHRAALSPPPRVSSQLANCGKQDRHNAGRKVKVHHEYCPQATE